MFELRSERLKRVENPNRYDVYDYSPLSEKFRKQIIYLFENICNHINESSSLREAEDFITFVSKRFCEEKGILDEYGNDRYDFVFLRNYILSSDDSDCLDLIEIFIKWFIYILNNKDFRKITEPFVNTLNSRFRTNNLGYEFIENQLIKKDTQYTHEEIIKPTLKLIYDENFTGVEEEFLNAHDKFINNEFKEAITESNKAFESTMKTICERKEYDYNKDKDTAKKLIDILLKTNFIPKYLSTHATGLRTTLEAGLPTVRNREGGHGQGEIPIKVTESYAKYALNLTATNISFLINLYKESIPMC